MRALELLDSFIKQQADSPHVVDLLLPLIKASQAAESNVGGSKALVDRISGVLKRLCAIKDYVKGDLLPVATCHEVFPELFQFALKSSTQVAGLASAGILFLIKILRSNGTAAAAAVPVATPKRGKGKKGKAEVAAAVETHVLGALDIELVAKLYIDTFNDFMAKKNRVRSSFFQQLCRIQPTVGWHVADAFVAGITAGKNEFLKGQAMAMFQELIPRQSAAASLPEGAAAAATRVLNLAVTGAAEQLAASAVEGAEVKIKFVRDTLGFSTVLVKALAKLAEGGSTATAELIVSLKSVLASGLVAQSAPVKNMSNQVLRTAEALAKGESSPAKTKGAAKTKGGKGKTAVAAAEGEGAPASAKKKSKKRKDAN